MNKIEKASIPSLFFNLNLFYQTFFKKIRKMTPILSVSSSLIIGINFMVYK